MLREGGPQPKTGARTSGLGVGPRTHKPRDTRYQPFGQRLNQLDGCQNPRLGK